MNSPSDVTMDSGLIIEGPAAISFYQLCAQRMALKLEMKGMKHSSGRSMYAFLKKQYGWKGNKEKVLEKLNQLINERGLTAEVQAGIHR